MAVRRVDDEDVDPGGHERRRSLAPVWPRADGSADAQAPLLVLDGLRVLVGLEDVLDRDEADQTPLGIDDEELLDAVLVEEALGLVDVDARRNGHELLRHQRAHRLVEVLLEADVARRQDADGPLALDDGNAADVVLAHHLERGAERLRRAAR